MRRPTLLVLIAAACTAISLFVAGCGGSSDEPASEIPTDVPEFAEIVPEVNSAMADADSASFNAELSVDIEAASGSQLAPFAGDAITLKASGAASETATDLDLTATGAGQEWALSLVGDESFAFLQYKDVWYDLGSGLMNPATVGQVGLPGVTGTTGATAPTTTPEQVQSALDQYGITATGSGDTAADGSPTYKYAFSFADPTALAGAIRAADPTEVTPAEARAAATLLASDNFQVSIEIYTDTDQLASVAASFGITADEMAQISGESAQQFSSSGLESIDFNLDVEFSSWGEPVTVSRPTGDVRSKDELMQTLMPDLYGLAAGGAGMPPMPTTPATPETPTTTTTAPPSPPPASGSPASGSNGPDQVYNACIDSVGNAVAGQAGVAACNQIRVALRQCFADANASDNSAAIQICQQTADQAIEDLQAYGE